MLMLWRVLSCGVLILGGVWAAIEPSFESLLAALAGAASLAATFIRGGGKDSSNDRKVQSQTVGQSSSGIQAGRDVHITHGQVSDDK